MLGCSVIPSVSLSLCIPAKILFLSFPSFIPLWCSWVSSTCLNMWLLGLASPSAETASGRHAYMKPSVQSFFIRPFTFLWPTLACTLQEEAVELTASSSPHRCFLMLMKTGNLQLSLTCYQNWPLFSYLSSWFSSCFLFSFIFGPGLYVTSFYSACSLCFISWRTPSSEELGWWTPAAPRGSPLPFVIGIFLWQNSLNCVEVGTYLEEKRAISPAVQRDDTALGILYPNFQLSHLIWKIKQSWGKVTSSAFANFEKGVFFYLCYTITGSWIMF